jgi:hypothetical protein
MIQFFLIEDFIQKRAYLEDIFEKLNTWNESMQGPLTQNDKINAFMKTLEFWKRNVERNIFYIFHTFEKLRPRNKREAKKKRFINHLELCRNSCLVF